MGFGVFFLVVIFVVFVVTNMLKFDAERASMDMAAELGLILLGGFCLYLGLYFVRAVI
jgi:hypothetical protein